MNGSPQDCEQGVTFRQTRAAGLELRPVPGTDQPWAQCASDQEFAINTPSTVDTRDCFRVDVFSS